MLKNLILTAFRNVRKDFGYGLINIIGLTLGITSALLLIIYVADELNYDRYHEKASRIYRVTTTITENDDRFTWIITQVPFGPQVIEDYPEVESMVRLIHFNKSLFRYGDREFNEERFLYADSTVFEIFTYKFLAGNPRTALTEPNTIVLTRSTAKRYFGNDNPIGKGLVSGDLLFRITGVIDDVPGNSHIRFDALVSRTTLPARMGSWRNFGRWTPQHLQTPLYTYLLLPEGVDFKEFGMRLNEMYDRYMADIFERVNIRVEYNLEPITRIHLHSKNAAEPEPTGSTTYVYLFLVVAFFLIIIAAMNYMNLATARSIRRAREVGLRKVLGSGKAGLVLQFLAESAVLTVIALVLSLALVELVLPGFNMLAGKNFEISVLFSPVIVVSVFAIILLVGILGGSYPAFYLSGFNPAKVLKGEISRGRSGDFFRKVLIITQFTVSVVMIVCTLTVSKQINFLKNKDAGYTMENIICVQLTTSEMSSKAWLFKQLLLKNPGILSATCTNWPLGGGSPKMVFLLETTNGMEERTVNFTVVDHDFVETFEIDVLEGRDFSQDMPTDTLLAVVINETLAKRMNWSEPLGKKIELGDSSILMARVIGVIKDYHQTGIYDEVESLMLTYRLNNSIIYIKLDRENTRAALSQIEKVWTEMFPDQPFSWYFLSDRFYEQFGADEKRSLIFTIFTILAIFIAILGLYGLVSYMVEQRTREIGIRKIFGANEIIIVKLISFEFLKLVSVSVVLAIPIAYYFMTDWLENFVYRTSPGVFIFILAALIAIVMTFITVNLRAWRAATANPVDALRVE
jgi:putative ABC transport system permease protein